MKYITCFIQLFCCCSVDNDYVESEFLDDGHIFHTTQLMFNGCIDHFDVVTRSVTTNWADGAKLYIKFSTASSIVYGVATYRKNAELWEVQNYGTLTNELISKCEIFFFDKPQSTTMNSVVLSAQTAVFTDSQASYLYKDGVIILTAHLKPLTGRLRFRGMVGQQVTFSGLKWYSGYDITTNTLSTKSSEMTLTVASDGYTPYVYARFADVSTPQITVNGEDDDYFFRKMFDSSVLATGKSGFLDIPTITSRYGWQLIDGTKQELEFIVTGNGKTVTFKMLKVESGTFQMGKDSGGRDNTPVHSVILTKSYYMGETELTQALWYAIMGPTYSGSSWSSSYGLGDNYPAYDISYEDCQQFLTKLNQLTGQQFRFPTEAEWEFAAKGGTRSKGYSYSGSNTIDDVAWYEDISGSKTHEVAGKAANELGLYDMSGNVWEWCYDWYGSYSSSAQTDPTGATSGSIRVCRGGSWVNSASNCRCALRSNRSVSNRINNLGLRLAL